MNQTQIKKIEECINYARTLIGIKYSLWNESMDDTGPFNYAQNDIVPQIKIIKANGINCTGLTNLMRRFMKLEIPGRITGKPIHKFAGGTYCWFNYLLKENRLELIDYTKTYPIGTLLISNYKNEENQGHVSVLTNITNTGLLYQSCIHSYFTYPIKKNKLGQLYPGVAEDKFVAQSAFWQNDGTFTHICYPQNWLLLN